MSSFSCPPAFDLSVKKGPRRKNAEIGPRIVRLDGAKCVQSFETHGLGTLGVLSLECCNEGKDYFGEFR